MFPPRSSRCRALACLLALAGVACSDSSGPSNPISVSVVLVRVEGPDVTALPQGQAVIECGVDLRAEAVGSGAATWHGGIARFFIGVAGTPAVDSVSISPSEVRATWGGEITADSAQFAGWLFSAPVPFSVELEFQYQPDASQDRRSASVTFSCGPIVT